MAYGHITGNMLTKVEGHDQRLVNLVVDSICRSFVGDSTDEGVQLQIIKALLTAVSSNICAIHEGHLLKAVRTVYNIYLISKNLVNQTTAKATLTQMLNLVFQRMESLGTAEELTSELAELSGAVKTAAADAAATEAVVAAAVPAGAEGEVEGGEAEAPVAEEGSAAPSPAPAAASPEGGSNSRPGSPTGEGAVDEDANSRFLHVYRKDAFLVFRSMCKLSMKELPTSKDVIDAKSHELRSKLLSLELQLSILQNAGPVFQSDPLFIDVVIKYLCVALSKNGVSHIPSVFNLALSIFLALVQNFRHHLKMQIEVFFKEILLSMLEISTSSFQHKWSVLICLTRLCSQPQTVVDLYLNYDCDEYLNNVFERMISDLARVAQGRASSELGGSPQQEAEMKVKGLECLVLVVRVLREWSKEMDDPSALATAQAIESEVADKAADGADGAGPADDQEEAEAEAGPAEGEAAEDFEARKRRKDMLEAGIKKFNTKPKKGVAYLQENDLLGKTPRDVAAWLLKDERLDKTQIGEYLGEPHQLNLDTMHAYTDLIDFRDLPDYVDALRTFLGGFRLPGEAQKIDRLMEKFAGTWYGCHPKNGIFASPDAAYVLAYSIIMLTTDLHSANVKKKMTVVEFVKNNRGINDNKDLPKEYLEGVYAAIDENEIKMKGPQTVAVNQADLQNKQKRKEYFKSHMEDRSAMAQEMMKGVEGSNAKFLTAKSLELVRPMFKVSWQALLAALTRPLQESDDPFIISLCLEGLQSSIHIACIFDMEEAGTFLQSLSKFTHLTKLSEMKLKHVEAQKALLAVGATDGNYLGESWQQVLRCVSQLEMAAVVGSSADHGRRQAVGVLTETASQTLVVSTDKIFETSKNLNGEAIVCFVRWLCKVSLEELQASPPRIYSLQKLVEIAYYNMERIRMEWSRIWAVMGDHFNKVGCMADLDVSRFAVDSLRQLSIKFLEKGELANFSFQKDFLRPFEYIMSHNKAPSIRDLVVQCVAQMVQAKANNIQSGWKNIFFVFSLAASDNDQNIVDLAFNTTKLILEEHFSKKNTDRARLISGSFMDAVNCLAEFASNSFFPDVSMEAIRQLRNCASYVDETPEFFETGSEEADTKEIWVRGWFPVLFGLSRIIDRCKLDVRTRALQVMMEIMKTYGENFLAQWWKDLFGMIFRIFDDKKIQGMNTAQDRTTWMNTTCNHALRSIVDVVTMYFVVLQDVLLKETFDLLKWCIHKSNEQLARTGTECLHILVMSNGTKFTDESWQLACDLVTSLFDTTAPKELHNYRPDPAAAAAALPLPPTPDAPVEDGAAESPAAAAAAPAGKKLTAEEKAAQQEEFEAIIIKCVVQLELIQTVEWILLSSTNPNAGHRASQAIEDEKKVESRESREEKRADALGMPIDKAGEMFECLSATRLTQLLDCLMTSHEFAKDFNADKPLRMALWKAGFMRNRSKPNLLKQETTSLGCALRIMFRMYTSEAHAESVEKTEAQILEVCKGTLQRFVLSIPAEARHVWAPYISLILREVLSLDNVKFEKFAAILYDQCTEMMVLAFDQKLGQLVFYLAQFFAKTKSIAFSSDSEA